MVRRTLIIGAISLGMILVFVAIGMGFLLRTPKGADLVLRTVADHFALGDISWGPIESDLLSGISLHDLEVKEARHLPSGTIIRIQELTLRVRALTLEGVELRLINARIFLSESDPVIVEGSLKDGSMAVNVYSRTFNLMHLKNFIPNFKYLQAVCGSLKDIDLRINGGLRDFKVQGQATVERWRLENYVLQDVPLKIDLNLQRLMSSWLIRGKISASSGEARTPHVMVRLLPSRIYFNGDPRRPELDLHGQTRIARTRIDIGIKGSREKPKAVLTSEPALPQEQLLLMMTTGRHWKGFNTALAEQRMAPELAVDFVDYFLFGGTGQKIFQLLGFSEFSIRMGEASQGVTIGRDITDRIGLGYDAQVSNAQTGVAREFKQTVSGEYDVTDRMTIGVQKEIVPVAQAEASTDTEPIADDRIFLKYKKDF